MAKKKAHLEDEPIKIVDVSTELDAARPYMAKFEKARNFNSDRQDTYAELMAFYQGNQHLLKKYKEVKPWVINMNTPYASVAIDNRVSSLLANDYSGDLLPLSSDDTEKVAILDTVKKREWKRLNLDQFVKDSIKRSAVVREYYTHIYYDKNKVYGGTNNKRKGTLCAYTIEPGAIYIDPEARSLKDARYMFVMGRIGKEEAKEKYPKLEALFNNGDSFTAADRGENYIDNDYYSQQENVLTTITYYGKKKDKIERVKLISSIIVEDPVDMPLKKGFPVAQMRWKQAAQSCYGLSLMDEVLSLQKSICSIQSAITNTALAYAAPSMMVRKGCGVDPKVVAKASGAPGVVYHVDGDLDNALKPVIPPKIDQNIVNIMNEYINAINSVTGVSNQFLGDIGSAGNTSGGTKVAVERAKIIEVDVLNNIEQYVEDIDNILVDYICNIYEGETMTYREDKTSEGEFNFKEVQMPSAEDLEDVQYQYYIKLDTKTPYSKERQKEQLLQLYETEQQYDAPVKTVTIGDIIRNFDLENKDEILGRYSQLTNQDAQTKTDTIRQLINTSNEFGAPEELINGAINEIIAGAKETPNIDQLMQMLEQGFQQQMTQQRNQEQQSISNMADMLPTPQGAPFPEQQNMGAVFGQQGPQMQPEMPGQEMAGMDLAQLGLV